MYMLADYHKMKNSGIEWIGKIPIEWKVRRGKTILTLLQRPILESDEIVTCFRDGEVTLRKNRREEGFTNAMKEIGYQGVEPGDLVVHGMDGFAGAIGICDSRGKVSPVLNVMDSSQNKYFLAYYLRALAYRDVFMALSTGIRVRSCDLRWNKLATLPYVLPPIKEQDKIVTYLDAECAKIEEIIIEIKTSIEDYKQWKISIVSEAIASGLNPEIEKRDSGNKRIGMIPAHWVVRKMKTFVDNVSSGLSAITSDTSADESGKYVLRTSAVSSGIFKPEEVKSVLSNALDRLICPMERDTLVMSRMNTASMVGYCAYIADNYPDYFLPDKLWKIHTKTTLMAKYAWFLINAPVSHDWFASVATGTSLSMLNISLSDFYNLVVAVPPVEEQKEICDYLEEKCTKIDACIREKQALIYDLESYKKSLIYEVVTGKRKVV